MLRREMCGALWGLLVAGCGAQDEMPAPTDWSEATTSTAPSDGEGGATSTLPGGGGGGAGGEAQPVEGFPFDPEMLPDGFDEDDLCRAPTSPYATDVLGVMWGPGQDFGRTEMPGIVLGPPRGAGRDQGSLDVASLGNGGSIVLGSAHNAIVDEPGADFLVFENPFEVAGGDAFVEPAVVEVSDDGEAWRAFPCASEPPFAGCAGLNPVLQNGDGAVSLDSGGDAFDLADVGLSRARFVRIVDRQDRSDTVFDLDAIGIVHGACP